MQIILAMHRVLRQSSPARLRATTTTSIKVGTVKPIRPTIASPINHIPTTNPPPSLTHTRPLTTTTLACRIPHHRPCRGRGRRTWLPLTLRTRRQQRALHNGALRVQLRRQEIPAATILPSRPQALATALPTPRSHSHSKGSVCALSRRPKPEARRPHTTNNYNSSNKGSNSMDSNSSSRATAGT